MEEIRSLRTVSVNCTLPRTIAGCNFDNITRQQNAASEDRQSIRQTAQNSLTWSSITFCSHKRHAVRKFCSKSSKNWLLIMWFRIFKKCKFSCSSRVAEVCKGSYDWFYQESLRTSDFDDAKTFSMKQETRLKCSQADFSGALVEYQCWKFQLKTTAFWIGQMHAMNRRYADCSEKVSISFSDFLVFEV